MASELLPPGLDPGVARNDGAFRGAARRDVMGRLTAELGGLPPQIDAALDRVAVDLAQLLGGE
jgi:hypothetical protein